LSVYPRDPLSNQQFFIRRLQGGLRFGFNFATAGSVARGQTSRSSSVWTQVVNDK
jgi:hypothetical protein